MIERAGSLLPFLKWAGGKRWLSGSLTSAVRQCMGTYFEPFLGSGAVFFHQLPTVSHLSDANADLIECYLAIRENHVAVEDELADLSEHPPATAYYAVRQMRPETRAGRAARFLYLNRTCWNGLYRVNLRGEFNVPRGTKTQILLPTDNFSAVAAALKKATILASDFENSINLAGQGDVVFADPPYTVAHNMNGFVKYNQTIFSWNDQIRLARVLADASIRGATVIATNADHPEVRSLYDPHFAVRPLSRASIIAASANNRRTTTELFITNNAASLS